MGRGPTAVPMRGALGFAALIVAAGLWVFRKRHDYKETENEGGNERRASVVARAPPPILADISDDEDDDLWEHIASMLDARKRSGARTKGSIESEDEVWRIIAQIVAARGLSHSHFQSPDRTSTASVKELRRWFESQAAEKAALASSAHVAGRESETSVGVKENGYQLESKGLAKGGEEGGLLGKARQIIFADDESSDKEDVEWEAIKARALKLAKTNGEKLDGERKGPGITSRKFEQVATGANGREVASRPDSDRQATVTGVEASGGVVKKMVQRQNSIPAERNNDVLEKVPAKRGSRSAANAGEKATTKASDGPRDLESSEGGSKTIVQRPKSPPVEREIDALKRLKTEGGSVSAGNGRVGETTKVDKEAGNQDSLGGVVKKIVRKEQSPPAEAETDALERLKADRESDKASNSGGERTTKGDDVTRHSESSGGGVKKVVRREKSPPAEAETAALERLKAEGGLEKVSNGGGDRTAKANDGAQSDANAEGQKENRKGANGKSSAGGSEYQGPPRGEDRVVVYLTSVRAVRKTFEQCATVSHIFHGFSVAVDERDISIHLPYRQELKDLLGGRAVSVPQVFIRGKHIGGLQEVQYLTDEKTMRELLVGMPRIKVTEECEGCGGGRFLPCAECRGSQKVLVGDKTEACTACNEYGLIRCPMCS